MPIFFLRGKAIVIFLSTLGFISLCFTNKANTSAKIHAEEQIIVIPFKTTLESEIIVKLEETLEWKIYQNGNPLPMAHSFGDSLLRYVFNTPGDYYIQFTDHHQHNPDECGHAHFPDRQDVKVSPVKMTFLMNTVSLSGEIVGGQEVDGMEVTVDVMVEIFNNLPVEFPYPTFRSEGAKTTIKGTLENPNTILTPGINNLKYILSGQATSSTYIMFDFLDYNGNIQCYYLQNQIK